MISDRNTLMTLATYEGLPYELAVATGSFFLPKEWLDAEIEVQGFSYPMYSSSGRATGFRFHVSGTNFVRILSPGISNRFERPLLTIAEAARLPEEWGPRVRIAGTVTVHRPGIAFFLDDGTGVMHVDLLHHLATPAGTWHLDHEPQTWLQPGERVEVIGVRHNWFSLTPTLIHAEYRRIGRGPEIRPIEVSFADLRAGRHSGQLVTLEARLIDQRKWSTVKMRYQSLVLRVGDDTFQARWESEVDAGWNLKVDSYVRVTGVNDAEGSPSRKGSTFQLLLRSPADVVPAPAPRFWTRPEVQRVLLGPAAPLVAAWILFQRQQMRQLERRVAERTADLSGANTRLQEEVAARERRGKLRVALAAEKELNQLKSSFVSMVSHEFRTPLEVILSSSHILDRYLDRLPPENRREQLRAIRESVHRMSDLMEDVLTLGKFEAARMTCAAVPINLTAFCQRCLDEIESATESVCPIRFTTTNVNGETVGDESLLGPILTNLLSNAVKYSTPGEPVDFIVTRRGVDAELVVRDTGCGIPAADQPRLFTAFHRAGNVAHISGSGLGLVIVQRCVELHGGSIQCLSEEGKGTTFTVTLPLFDGTRQFRRNTAPATTQS
jgi:signal transduction histidine kinase